MTLLEACCTSIESAQKMLQAGAHRVELCSNLEYGGLTPVWLSRLQDNSDQISTSHGMHFTDDLPQLPDKGFLDHVHMLIRCRPGDFCYSQAEVDLMCQSIRLCRKIGAQGVVIGALTPEGHLDLPALRQMIHAAIGITNYQPMNIVFHRAFDRCTDPMEALEQIINLGFHTILTSGQAPTAEEGIPLLKRLVENAAGRIAIMAGRGVTINNVARIVEQTGVPAIHLSERPEMNRISEILRHK